MFGFRRRPKKGERYEVVKPFVAHVLTTWKAPFTGGHDKELPRGLLFVIALDPPKSATAAAADAEPPSDWEKILVEAKDREDPKYSGFYLVIEFEQIRKNCKRVKPLGT